MPIFFTEKLRYEQSMDLSKKDGLLKINHTAAELKMTILAEFLLGFFVENYKIREGFTSTLLTCYDIVRPDVALELAWEK